MKTAQAGSLESGDLLVLIRQSDEPGPCETRPDATGPGAHGPVKDRPVVKGNLIYLDSPVKAQFGKRIIQVVAETLAEAGVAGVEVSIQDRGALDYAIRARVRAASDRFQAKADRPLENAEHAGDSAGWGGR
jgi:citrate lyase subunit gamma (acyl carrier protein)